MPAGAGSEDPNIRFDLSLIHRAMLVFLGIWRVLAALLFGFGASFAVSDMDWIGIAVLGVAGIALALISLLRTGEVAALAGGVLCVRSAWGQNVHVDLDDITSSISILYSAKTGRGVTILRCAGTGLFRRRWALTSMNQASFAAELALRGVNMRRL